MSKDLSSSNLSALVDKEQFWVAVNDYPSVHFQSYEDALSCVKSAPDDLKSCLSIYKLNITKVFENE